MVLIQDHLRKIGSRLASEVGKTPNIEILQQMELIFGPNEHLFPRNVALMMFNENPEKYFPYTRVEVVHFPNGADDPEFREFPVIIGPIPMLIEKTLSLLKTNFLKEQVIKIKGQSKSVRIWNYPYEALKEAVANALYHRDYQVREPVEIRVYPDSIVILNYGGPDRSINMNSFTSGRIRPRRYRNRRLGDFLKELQLTEGKATGIPAILKAVKNNGSPSPHFDTDDNRSFFELELFKHSASLSISEGAKKTAQIGYSEIEKLAARLSPHLSPHLSPENGKIIAQLLIMLENGPMKREHIMSNLGKTNNTRSVRRYIEPLEKMAWISKTLPDKPKSKHQQYVLTAKARRILKELKT